MSCFYIPFAERKDLFKCTKIQASPDSILGWQSEQNYDIPTNFNTHGLYYLKSVQCFFFSSSSGSCQHLLLATMFALNFCYQPVDLVLIIKCGILEILSMLTNNSCALMNQSWFAASSSGSMVLSGAVRLASTRLLQILTVAARWEWGGKNHLWTYYCQRCDFKLCFMCWFHN